MINKAPRTAAASSSAAASWPIVSVARERGQYSALGMLVFISDIHLRAGGRTNVPRVEQFWQRLETARRGATLRGSSPRTGRIIR